MATLSKALNKKSAKPAENLTLQSSLASANELDEEDVTEENSETDMPVDEEDAEPAATEEADNASEAGVGGVENLPKSDRERAYELFDKAKSRNEWLELAQLLGKAATQYAAAQSGMQTGRPMGGLQIPEIDYSKKTEGEERMLERRLRDIRQAETAQARAGAITAAQQQKAAAAEKAQQWKEKEFGLKERQTKVSEAKAAREAAKPQLSEEEKIRLREESKLRVGEEFATRAKDKAIDALIASQAIVVSPDSTPQQKEQAKKDLLKSAKVAGIDMNEVYQQAQVPGRFFGTNLDETKIIPILQKMKSIGQPSPAAAAQPATAPAPASAVPAKTTALPPTKVRVKYQGKVLEIPQENLQEALKDGAELVK